MIRLANWKPGDPGTMAAMAEDLLVSRFVVSQHLSYSRGGCWPATGFLRNRNLNLLRSDGMEAPVNHRAVFRSDVPSACATENAR